MVGALLLFMSAGLVVAVVERQWLTAFLVIVIMGITTAPVVLRHRIPVQMPPEFQVLAVLFMFASLFLGEIANFYERVWWWDMALHATSGLLMGMVGFLLVYVLNENSRIDLQLRPRFVALFAFLFAVAVGVFWELFEFTVDGLLGTRMQKPMLGDPSGLTDTMWDLFVDAVGALIVSARGGWYMSRPEESAVEAWIHRFIESNPRFFRR